MKSSVTKAFRKRLNGLPASVQDQAARAYALWRSDPYHTGLGKLRVEENRNIPFNKWRV